VIRVTTTRKPTSAVKAADHTMAKLQGQAATRVYLWAVVLWVTTAFAGCTEPDSPEAEVRHTLEQAELAIEARDSSDVLDLMSAEMRDGYGRSRNELAQLLRGYFLTHPRIHVLSRIESIEFPAPDLARVNLTAGVFNTEASASLDLAPEVYRLRIELEQQDGEWRFMYAERRAKP
jgi:hypothetical protein